MYGVDFPKGVWHKLESLETGSVVFECKEGPFVEHEVEGGDGSEKYKMKSEKLKSVLKGIWAFWEFLFVPQKRAKDYYSL